MPIKINLLAETQIAEELRRRDPVKRAIFVGAFLIALMLVWSSSLQLEAMISKKSLADVQAQIETHSDQYQNVVGSLKKINEAKNKLAALQKLSAARFLQGNLLNALQESTLDNVQLARLRVDQSYFNVPGAPAKTNDNHVTPGYLATTHEKIVVVLDAKDFSASPGDAVNKFKEMLANQSYFKSILSKTNGVQLTSLSPQQSGPDGKAYVLFTLECDLPEQIR
ncbi:MAG TPA: hypothetical protein VIK59_06760 [Verrucomicrobiae bacterium]